MLAFIRISHSIIPPPFFTSFSPSISPLRPLKPLHHNLPHHLPLPPSSCLSPQPPPLQPTSPSLPSFPAILNTLTSLFPFWVTLSALSAYIHPPTFLWFPSSFIIPTLSLIMLGMGLTISRKSFLSTLSTPHSLFLGAACQYTIMPFLSTFLAYAFKLPTPFAVGLILVGVCPGGAASNLVCLIARADVSLSVLLTLVSTIVSVLAIPILMKLLAGALVPVSTLALFQSAAQVVLIPLTIGSLLNVLVPALVRKVMLVLPFISVLCVALICGSCVAANAPALAAGGFRLFFAVGILHAAGGVLAYVLARLFGLGVRSSRTVSIEVMMQNSTMAVSLAALHFVNPLTAVPGAISAVMHSIFGSLIAGTWRWMDKIDEGKDKGM